MDHRRELSSALIAFFALAVCWSSHAFERDTHYYGTYALALTTCFDWEEAHLIASADVMVDGNRSTVAEHSPTKRHNKIAWHAFGHSSERYHELWRRVLDETDPPLRLVKLGQLLHFVQDWEAHARYPVHLGHAKATILGHDPDSLARSEPRTRHGVQATLDHLAAMCGEMGRLPQGILDPDEALPEMLHTVKRDRLVLDLMAASDPAWRATPTGHLTKHGEEIMAENVERVERYILANLSAVPAKNVPADFRPGSDTLGIPEPLPITFDLDGNPTGDLASHVEAAGRQPVDDQLDPGDQRVQVVATKPTETGWIVRVVVDNPGDREIEAGELTVHVVDGISEEPVGESKQPLPALAPAASVEVELPIETTRPVEVALIGASAHADADVDPYTSDVWTVHHEHRSRLEAHVAEHGGLHGAEPAAPRARVELVHRPRIWMTSGDALCTSVVVQSTGEDPTVTVQPARISLASGAHRAVELTGFLQRVWTVTPEVSEGIPAVKTFACFEPTAELCSVFDETARTHRLGYTVQAGLYTHTEFAELDESIRRRITTSCGSGGAARSSVDLP